jgi:hypothetical protein
MQIEYVRISNTAKYCTMSDFRKTIQERFNQVSILRGLSANFILLIQLLRTCMSNMAESIPRLQVVHTIYPSKAQTILYVCMYVCKHFIVHNNRLKNIQINQSEKANLSLYGISSS